MYSSMPNKWELSISSGLFSEEVIDKVLIGFREWGILLYYIDEVTKCLCSLQNTSEIYFLTFPK